MQLEKLNPKQVLDKVLLSHRVSESDMKKFTTNLKVLLDKINEDESEENQKIAVRDFLKNTFYTQNEVNTKERIDLAIHKGSDKDSPVSIIVELKKPSNKSEMLSAEKPNRKALQELVLYYLRERIEEKNTDIQYLMATNIYEWYIFDAKYFEDFFYKNTKFKKDYEEWASNKKSSEKTDFFYNDIAKIFIENLDKTLPCAYFDLRHYEKKLSNEQDESLQELYKILSPKHLLHTSFANDSNELNEGFYRELLHIIGLEEVKEGGKSIIQRKVENRNAGSLLELVIDEIKTEGLHKVPDIQAFGTNSEERNFNVALELCITWVNRILFLKLLEGQLLAYHDGEQNYRFLNSETIHDFDELFKLFHKVLAVNTPDRSKSVQQKYSRVPYLNSSLFEISDLEDSTIKINALDNSEVLPFYAKTVLSELKNKKDTLTSLAYLFQFLDAYDFSGEGSKGIVKDNKTLINASVLGKVFEKINGYKDGSVYTPAFITMYMCQQSLEMAVLEKFNQAKNWNCLSFSELKNKDFSIKEANDITNSLKICDPAVGSGHFLVSALNQILFIKHQLGIFCDKDGLRLKNYAFEIINDELSITEDGEKVRYNPKNKESQRLQETLFREKQTIIESCLFGVDINTNSVKICRLRLWIELLKNAFYKENSSGVRELETLPNIDINIKCGNSLLSRFKLNEDLKAQIGTVKIAQYKKDVFGYKHNANKEEKQDIIKRIESIKEGIRTHIGRESTDYKKLATFNLEYRTKYSTASFFEDSLSAEQKKDKKRLEDEVSKYTKIIEDTKNNVVFKNAFEWRFEFPEVLDDDGSFNGFDVVIGNPPYISAGELSDIKIIYQKSYENTGTNSADLYIYFIEKAFQLLKPNGDFSYIIPNKWMKTAYGLKTRNWLKGKGIMNIIDFGDLPVFQDATVYASIIAVKNQDLKGFFNALNIKTLDFEKTFKEIFDKENTIINIDLLDNQNGWNLSDSKNQILMNKLRTNQSLSEVVENKIFYGIKTGLNEAFIINQEIKEQLVKDDVGNQIIKPFLIGKDIKKYASLKTNSYLIKFSKGVTNALIKDGRPNNWIEIDYPNIYKFLLGFKEKATNRYDKGDYYWELRTCDYYSEFEKPKILWPGISEEITAFALDETGLYGNDNTQFIGSGSKFLLGVLNSKVSYYFLKNTCDFVRGGFARLKMSYVKQIPIPKAIEDDEREIIAHVEQILLLKSQNEDTSDLEKKIDKLVYELYGLSAEEIELIEKA